MCQQAGIEGNKTNHSLRATGATQLYESGVPEKLVQERTGHRSLEALRVYERTNEEQHKAVSSILSATNQKSYTNQLYAGVKPSISHKFSEIQCGLGQYTPPGFSFQNLYGCTINISTPTSSSSVPANTSHSVTESLNEVEVDKLIAAIQEPSSE